MATLITDLEADHARFRRYLVWLNQEIGALAAGRRPDYLLLNELAMYFADYPDELHHKKEDIIYAWLAETARSRDIALENLQEQHADLSLRAKRFAEIVLLIINNEQLPIAEIVEEAAAYHAILTAHMSGEETFLFKPARALLKKDDWWEIEQAIGDLYADEINFDKARSVLAIEALLDKHER
jgi:hemerythrin-like domain-containing protein